MLALFSPNFSGTLNFCFRCNICDIYKLRYFRKSKRICNFFYHCVRCSEYHNAFGFFLIYCFFYLSRLPFIKKKSAPDRRQARALLFGGATGNNSACGNKQSVVNYIFNSAGSCNFRCSVALTAAADAHKSECFQLFYLPSAIACDSVIRLSLK